MKLTDIFNHLSYGEFSHLHLGEKESNGEFSEEKQMKLISHINAAMSELYSRFTLRRGSLRVTLTEGQTLYYLRPEHALSNSRARGDRYLDDLEMPLKAPVKKVLSVSANGSDLDLNTTSVCSVHTPSFDILKVPEALEATELEVEYRATPELLTEDSLCADPEYVEIELPYVFINALGYFIASRVLSAMNGESAASGNNYLMKFEKACIDLKDHGEDLDEGFNEDIRSKGWI